MRIKLKVGKMNTKCGECGLHLAGKQAVLLSPNVRSEKRSWTFCKDCFFGLQDGIQQSQGYDSIKKLLEE
jgi:hypothetical protein